MKTKDKLLDIYYIETGREYIINTALGKTKNINPNNLTINKGITVLNQSEKNETDIDFITKDLTQFEKKSDNLWQSKINFEYNSKEDPDITHILDAVLEFELPNIFRFVKMTSSKIDCIISISEKR